MSGTLLALAALAVAAAAGCRPAADEPAPVAWDRVSCAECRMLVGDPRFAAQLRTESGEVRHFDDPGCLLIHLERTGVEVRSAWVHHAWEDRWLRLEEAGFLGAGPTPMGYGLGATAREAEGALSPEAARARMRSGR